MYITSRNVGVDIDIDFTVSSHNS